MFLDWSVNFTGRPFHWVSTVVLEIGLSWRASTACFTCLAIDYLLKGGKTLWTGLTVDLSLHLLHACLLLGGGNSLASKTSLHLPLLNPCDHLLGWTDSGSFFLQLPSGCLLPCWLAVTACKQNYLLRWQDTMDWSFFTLAACLPLATSWQPPTLYVTADTLPGFVSIVTSQIFFQICIRWFLKN